MPINDYELSKELEYLFASYLFQNKLQMKRLLGYLIQHANSTSDSAFDQKVIAMKCLGRGADFDPAENPVVRIEIGRLRKLLNRFYDEELTRPYKITIPLGQYRPVLSIEATLNKHKYLPELSPSPANPERLSVLLQFTTEGVDSPELYLLRHRIRIGITITLGKQEAVRLLVAIPGENGKVAADSIDFVMRVSLAAVDAEFTLSSEVCSAQSNEVFFSDERNLEIDYQPADIEVLLSHLVSELFDHEIGVLWRRWVDSRSDYKNVGALKVAALVQYQRYLFDENEENIRQAFYAIESALEFHPGDKIINLALADVYYRAVIHNFDVVADPIEKGLTHIREALRFSPASDNLHTLHALLAMFQQEYDYAIASLLMDEMNAGEACFAPKFHYHVLTCLMSDWKGGFYKLDELCNDFASYPKLHAVLAYIYYFLLEDKTQTLKWKQTIQIQGSVATVQQCIKLMKLPDSWSVKASRDDLWLLINSDLGAMDD